MPLRVPRQSKCLANPWHEVLNEGVNKESPQGQTLDLKCPKCGSVIYSRRNALCGTCGDRLPEELLFNAEQRAAVEKDLANLKERAKKEKAKSSDSPSGILMKPIDSI